MTSMPPLTSLTVVRATDLADHDWQPVADCPGVERAELWHGSDFTHSLIRYAPDSRTPGHPHHHAYHHLWIVSGTASIAGRHVMAGSYVVVPPDTAHTVGEVGPNGCVMFQMYRPMPGRHEPQASGPAAVTGGRARTRRRAAAPTV